MGGVVAGSCFEVSVEDPLPHFWRVRDTEGTTPMSVEHHYSGSIELPSPARDLWVHVEVLRAKDAIGW